MVLSLKGNKKTLSHEPILVHIGKLKFVINFCGYRIKIPKTSDYTTIFQ